jgi:FeS assembly SUF system protein
MADEFLQLESKVIEALKTVYDPEIPVNVYDMGLIYEINLEEEKHKVRLVMTLSGPNCPVADSLVEEVKDKVEAIDGVDEVELNLTFDPPWSRDMMSEEALLELGLL